MKNYRPDLKKSMDLQKNRRIYNYDWFVKGSRKLNRNVN